MLKRTWPYGTRLKAKIIKVHIKQRLVVLIDEKNEGHIICGGDHQIAPQVGLNIVMEFKQNGPMGGYWRIEGAAPTLLPGDANL